MRLQEISRRPGDRCGAAKDILTYSVLAKAEASFCEWKKIIVTRPATALRFSHAQYSPHYPYPSPHRSFSRLGL
jgi:hypothetical protein